MSFIDLDQDGDLDILGNCEEYYDPDRNTILGVVWFENPHIDRKCGISTQRGKPADSSAT